MRFATGEMRGSWANCATITGSVRHDAASVAAIEEDTNGETRKGMGEPVSPMRQRRRGRTPSTESWNPSENAMGGESRERRTRTTQGRSVHGRVASSFPRRARPSNIVQARIADAAKPVIATYTTSAATSMALRTPRRRGSAGEHGGEQHGDDGEMRSRDGHEVGKPRRLETPARAPNLHISSYCRVARRQKPGGISAECGDVLERFVTKRGYESAQSRAASPVPRHSSLAVCPRSRFGGSSVRCHPAWVPRRFP